MTPCGCQPQSPTQGCGSASMTVPVQSLYPENPCEQPSGNCGSVLFSTTTSGFVVPPAGGQSTMQVADGTRFTAGQWIQFVNPAGTFRITSIVGNNLTLSNALPDGLTPIDGNPIPPMQYPVGAAFVSGVKPEQMNVEQWKTKIQSILSLLTNVNFASVPQQGDAEELYLLGYVKSSLCSGAEEGCNVRKQKPTGAYIDAAGKLILSGAVKATAFEIPIPTGGLPAQNTTILNPTNGTGAGFLLTFINPTTGELKYLDLFSGKSNNKQYVISLKADGSIELVETEFRSRIALHANPYAPDVRLRGGSFTYGSSNDQEVLAPKLADNGGSGVCNITITEPFKPTWATHHIVTISKTYNAPQGEFLEIYAGSKLLYQEVMDSSHDYNSDIDLYLPVETTQLTFKCLDITNGSANSWSGRDFSCRILSKGYITLEKTTQPV